MFAPQCGQNGNINYHITHKFALNVTFTGRLFVKSKQRNKCSHCAFCKVLYCCHVCYVRIWRKWCIFCSLFFPSPIPFFLPSLLIKHQIWEVMTKRFLWHSGVIRRLYLCLYLKNRKVTLVHWGMVKVNYHWESITCTW